MSSSFTSFSGVLTVVFLFLPIFSWTSALDSLYIIPVPDETCSADRCLTLDQFAENASLYYTDETELVFMAGKHSLGSTSVVRHTKRFVMHPNVQHQQPEIVCTHNSGFAFYNVSNVSISNLIFLSCGNTTRQDVKFVLASLSVTLFQLSNSIAMNSSAPVVFADFSYCFLSHNVFNNSVTEGGVVIVHYSFVSFDGDHDFISNSIVNGGVINCIKGKLLFSGVNIFSHNVGFTILMILTEFNANGMMRFTNNLDQPSELYYGISDVSGSGVLALKSNITFSQSSTIAFQDNKAPALYLYESIANLRGAVIFDNNTGIVAGAVFIHSSFLSLLGNTIFSRNTARGPGAIYVNNSTLKFDDQVTFTSNRGIIYGALAILESDVSFKGNAYFVNNSALLEGGAIGARYSFITVKGNTTFTNNRAQYGGGLSFSYHSKFILEDRTSVVFRNNKARRGGAIYVDDRTQKYLCTSNPYINKVPSELTTCFISTNPPITTNNSVEITFDNNTASDQGEDIFGGMLDWCFAYKELFTTENGISLLKNITVKDGKKNVNESMILSSEPLQLCFCRNSGHDCTYNNPQFQVARGGTISITAVAVDQANEPVPATIISYIANRVYTNNDVSRGQRVQLTKSFCTILNFTIITELSEITLILYPKGPCTNLGKSRRHITVSTLPCPIAFELSDTVCVCEKRLQIYTNTCIVEDRSFRRNGNFWVGVFQNSSGNYIGLVLQPHCPLDYCRSDHADIDVHNLDSQCGFNRPGILCGSCRSNLSLSLGSSQCQECSNSLLLGLLVTFVNMGIALVFLLFLLRLTVSTGTLSGLIFYANIVAVNKAIFIPSGTINILTIFIAWINLDFGIETCFFSGMDTYWHTWLQFVFPIYIWILVALLIMGSRYIAKFPKILGQNPVSVLSTLFLLSYAKILRTLITTFSASVLEYPDNSTQTVWLYDGSIGYLKGKHVPLYLVSLIFLLFLFLPYTLFLLVGQWLLALSNKRMCRFMNSVRIKIFLDSYYAPYNIKHRYWPGLLLLLRCIMFLIFASNTNGDSVNLMVIVSTALVITMHTRIAGNIHLNYYLDILESSFHLNLGVLAVATYHVQLAGGNQNVVTMVSIGVAFFEFHGIVLYHLYIAVKDTAAWRSLRHSLVHFIPVKHNSATELDSKAPQIISQAVSSFTELREPLLDDSY